MSDVGDSVTVTYATRVGASVTATVTAPSGTVTGPDPVAEDPDAVGSFPFAVTLAEAGMWQVTFRATGTVVDTEHVWVWAQAPGPPPLATADQLAAVFRPLTEAERAVVTAQLDIASRLLRSRFPDLDQRIASGELDPMIAAAAAIQMVLRVARNPAGLRAEAVGPFRREFVVDDAASMGLVVTAAEEAMLGRPESRPPRPPAGTIRARAGLGVGPGSWWSGRVRRW